jgi:hypothetical protein
LDRPFYADIRELGRRVPEQDENGLRRYVELSRQMDDGATPKLSVRPTTRS